MTGHTVLQLPVPPLENWVRERTRFYDAGFVSADPRFGHAHITALAPFVRAPTATDLAEVGRIAAATAWMPIRLADLGQFPNGVIHLRPEPGGPLRALTEALIASFPDFPPYEGRFGHRVDPHLTLDAASPTVSLESTRRLLGEAVPTVCTLRHLQLTWWESDRCHVIHEWPLGKGDPLGLPRGTPVDEGLFPPPE